MKREVWIRDKQIKALIFDMDGLIFDSERIVQRAWTRTSEELGLPDVGAHIYYTIGFNATRREAYFYQIFGEDFPAAEFAVLSRKNFQDIARAEGIPVKPGVRELMRLAKKMGLKMAIATSTRKTHAVEMLTEAKLYQYFDGAAYGDMVKNAKPDPEIYITASKTLGVEPENCIALEDAPAGIQAAYAAGMLPVMIPDLVTPSDEILAMCYRCIPSLNGVVELLK